MATFNSSSKSNRLLQSKRYTIASFDSAEAYTNVLDINSSEVYTQQSFLPTSSAGLPYSASAQDGLTIDSGSTPIARFYYRMRLTPTDVVTSGKYQTWFVISGSDGTPVSPQSIQANQQVNFLSNKYIIAADALKTAEEEPTPGYNVVVSKGASAGSAVAENGDHFQFDYKTGVVQYLSTGLAPSTSDVLYLSGYVYEGKTLADETLGGGGDGTGAGFPFSGSAVITGSLLISGSGNDRTLEIDGSISASAGITGSLFGTATTASYVETAQTASFVTTAQTASFVETAQTASFVTTAQTASFVETAQTASFVTTAQTASYVEGANVDGAVANATNAASAAALDTDATGTNLTLSGDLSVAGTASFTNAENLAIKDKYILLSSGSTSVGDGGIVIQQSAGGVGKLFGYDSTTGRWAITSSFDADTAADFTPDAFMAVALSGSDISSIPSQYTASGNIFIDQNNEAYIYTVNKWEKLIFSGSNAELAEITASSNVDIQGTLSLPNISDVSASIAAIASAEDNAGIFAESGSSGVFATTSSLQITGSTLQVSPNTDSGANVTASNAGTGGGQANYAMVVSESVWHYNANVGVPTSNAWGSSGLGGSYFENFDQNTNISEVLRFVAGLLSASAPNAQPNTRIFNAITENITNNDAGSIPAGRVPVDATDTIIAYLETKGFASDGNVLFNGVDLRSSIKETRANIKYSSDADGSTTITSSADDELFGLGTKGLVFNVSGSLDYRFSDNASNTETATSHSSEIISQTGPGTTDGVTVATIDTANPAVIPNAFQDGKFVNIYSANLFNNVGSGNDFSAKESTGYYEITASIAIETGSAGYSSPRKTVSERILYTPIVDGDLTSQTLAVASPFSESLNTATSRSLSGAPYLLTNNWKISSSITGLFNPLYVASTTAARYTNSVTLLTASAVSGHDITLSTNAGAISTNNVVFPAGGGSARNSGTPHETDVVKFSGSLVFNAGSDGATNILQSSISPTTFNVNTLGRTRTQTSGDGTTLRTDSFNYFDSGQNGQPSDSGSMAYYGQEQDYDPGSLTGTSETFFGEKFRIKINNNLLNGTYAAGDKFTTASYEEYNLGKYDLQVKPGFLVYPGGTNEYWLANPDSSTDYKYYARAFQTDGNTKLTLSVDMGVELKTWDSTTAGIAAAVMFQSAASGLDTGGGALPRAKIYDLATISGTGNIVDNQAQNDQLNPFSNNITIGRNTNGGSISGTSYNVAMLNGANRVLNATYDQYIILVRYKGAQSDPLNSTGRSINVSYT